MAGTVLVDITSALARLFPLCPPTLPCRTVRQAVRRLDVNAGHWVAGEPFSGDGFASREQGTEGRSGDCADVEFRLEVILPSSEGMRGRQVWKVRV